MHKQLANAQVKLERAQQNAEEKRAQSHQTLERLQEEYEKMVVDRQVNDRKVEELRAEADEVERQVRFKFCSAGPEASWRAHADVCVRWRSICGKARPS